MAHLNLLTMLAFQIYFHVFGVTFLSAHVLSFLLCCVWFLGVFCSVVCVV